MTGLVERKKERKKGYEGSVKLQKKALSLSERVNIHIKGLRVSGSG